ncbi:MAG: hypothetical protein JRI49_07370 [Deltaproteobacteria bacterium]|nr:hypothetical protein [Deltaproteobacteria bacterium]
MKNNNRFHFYTRLNQTELLGKKARNLVELLEGIKSVPDSSIYHHTHRFIQQHHYMSPQPPNDFADWITDVLNEDALGEKMASVDVIEFQKIKGLRKKFIEILSDYLKEDKKVRDCLDNQEFHFMACRTFVLPTTYVARSVKQFRQILKRVSIHSLCFHIFEARMRLEKKDNDFSRWLRDLGERSLASKISKLDPYSYTLEALRKEIISIIDKENRKSG